MNQMIKLLQYADDTLGIVQDEMSAKHFLQVIIDFGHISGLTLNMTKTEAVWLGVNRNRTDKPLNIRWPALPIKVLGVYFGYDRELCEKRNFGDKIDKAKQIIKMSSFKFIVDSVELKCFLQIFDSDSEQIWALPVRQYFKTNNLDLSAAIKCPELSTCTKNLIFPSFYTKTFQLWDELIETEPCKKVLFIWYNPGIKINNTSIFWKVFLT